MERNFNVDDYLHARGLPDTGPICLVKATLLDAMEIYSEWDGDKEHRALFWETRVWLRSNDDQWIFSFITICRTLRLDPSAVRREAERRREETLARKEFYREKCPMSHKQKILALGGRRKTVTRSKTTRQVIKLSHSSRSSMIYERRIAHEHFTD